jgi:hypothetical protein
MTQNLVSVASFRSFQIECIRSPSSRKVHP